MRPFEILNTWLCEELLVTYGELANSHSIVAYDSMSSKDRATHKPKPILPMDRWAVPFFSPKQMEEMTTETDEEKEIDLGDIANFLLH